MSERLIGNKKRAVRAVQVCAACPRIVVDQDIDDFRDQCRYRGIEIEQIEPICPFCMTVGFVYLEGPWERDWIEEHNKLVAVRFEKWVLPWFVQSIAGLFGKDSRSFKNIALVTQDGFSAGHGR